MRKAALVLAGGVALMLSACGSETSGEFTTADGENAEYTIDKDTGETSMTIKGEDGEATLRSGADVPVNLPAGFTLFPGSKVITNTVVNQPDGQGTMVAFEADAPADKVVAHYRDAAKAAGFDIQLEMTTNGTVMIGGERKADESSITVTATTGDDSATTGQIIIGTKKAG
ncbi:hypothetical protein FHS52_001488 [Erythromicrobium ramosum]|uniref:Uncharacterized protein n=1 Tax=Erythrobacter ramosus TaxID=35811 RepID=A0A6I4UKK3_9SPHN|nr:hypothetical protein [Erythrobacter ramosus]MBB3775519.1 hypothetical protein [Erythrobacter ramosus]MXP39382.1 hypothetical protein [Erythrobacter ramosus]